MAIAVDGAAGGGKSPGNRIGNRARFDFIAQGGKAGLSVAPGEKDEQADGQQRPGKLPGHGHGQEALPAVSCSSIGLIGLMSYPAAAAAEAISVTSRPCFACASDHSKVERVPERQ